LSAQLAPIGDAEGEAEQGERDEPGGDQRRQRGDFGFDQKARANLPRIAAATIGMAAVLIGLRMALAPLLSGATAWRLAALSGLVASGLVAFLLLILALRVTGWRELRGQFGRQPA
jgi:hypothetical protein